MLARRIGFKTTVAILAFTTLMASGCSSVKMKDTVSPYCFPNGTYGGPRSEQVPINLIRLRQDPPAVYILGPGDTLGIYIEGILGNRDEPLPVHFPDERIDEQKGLHPSIGYPMPIREDGTLPLPLVAPIVAEGLTIAQLESVIRKAYTIDQKILAPGRDRIVVTMMQPRTYKVLVIREDIESTLKPRETSQGELVIGSDRSGSASLVELRAYENDVLHALSKSGGLPGLNARNEIVILRGSFKEAQTLDPLIEDVDALLLTGEHPTEAGLHNIIRIPLRATPGMPLQQLRQEDIILAEGDIVYIQSRDAEVFYTGGLLKGGQHPIPRDYDLDALGAIAMAGGSIAAAAGGANLDGRGVGVGSIFPPTRVLVLRMVNGQQQTIHINLKHALTDPAQRILIEPNDFIVLEYKPHEVVMNVILSTFRFNVNVNSLFGN